MRILITGSTGFIGQNLIPMIKKRFPKHDIMLLCRNTQKAIDKFALTNVDSISVHDANNWEEVKIFNPEIVFHLAAYSTSLNNEEAKRQLIDSNIIYGIDLLSALSYCNNLKLFINTGSFTEYRKGYRQIEDTYLYSATKSAFRPILDYYANLGNYKYITAVPYSVYGGIPTVKRIMDYMMDAAVAETPVDMTAGEQVLDFIHVDDIVAFFVSIIEKYDSYLKLEQGHEFHLGTGRGYTLREVATELENISGRKLNINWGGRQYRDRDTMYAVAPISYNSDTNLWKSKISLHEGLCQFVNLSQCLISKNY